MVLHIYFFVKIAGKLTELPYLAMTELGDSWLYTDIVEHFYNKEAKLIQARS